MRSADREGQVVHFRNNLTNIVVDFSGCLGESPPEYHWYFKGFQRRQTGKDAARFVGVFRKWTTRWQVPGGKVESGATLAVG